MHAAVLQNNAGIIEVIGVKTSFLPEMPNRATMAYGVHDMKNRAITAITRKANFISAFRLVRSFTCLVDNR